MLLLILIIITNYVPVVNLSTQDNTKLLQQLKFGFKRTINGKKYQSDPKTYAQSWYLNHLVDPSFQRVNRFFVLSFENENDRKSHSNCYLPKVTIQDYNVMIDVLINQKIVNLKHTKISEKMQQIEEMIIQLVVC